MADVILKDEGEFISVTFNSEKSKQSTVYKEANEAGVINKESESFSIQKESLNNMIVVLITHRLVTDII